MNKFEIFLKNNFPKILKFEIFIFLTLLYHLDEKSHQYFNNVDVPLNFNGIFAITMTIFFALYFFIVIVFPFILLVKLILIWKFKMINKRNILLLFIISLLYIVTIISLFSLYAMKQNLNISSKKQALEGF
ncbi:hypothetical protein GKZ90_0019200 [Flavobacterium sp. MC2016-06]|jgi:hypothetical protein|uniref:hypothetical protein n=1 Tax=Flavobacterium sp. MC2016-06 TaxID=2676308 RepID=UPI0012BAB827|nr:hypothetical protein [Flavobacterium sp. MC2016-06]MBU3861261.1 hypothetical protein [Flavobacterium sp. MC2016-06]